MAINSLPGKKFLLVTAAAVLGFGVAASFIVPSANAAQSGTTSVVTAPAVAAESNLSGTEAAGTEAAGIDCNNGLDANGAQCDGGPAANPNDNGVDVQSSSESQGETTASVDGDNIQSQN